MIPGTLTALLFYFFLGLLFACVLLILGNRPGTEKLFGGIERNVLVLLAFLWPLMAVILVLIVRGGVLEEAPESWSDL